MLSYQVTEGLTHCPEHPRRHAVHALMRGAVIAALQFILYAARCATARLMVHCRVRALEKHCHVHRP